MEPVVSMYKVTTTVTALTTGRDDIVRTQSQPVCQGHVKVRQHSSSIFIGSLFLEKMGEWVKHIEVIIMYFKGRSMSHYIS